MRKPTKFIVEFDYSADPDAEPARVQQDVAAEIGAETISSTTLTLDLDAAYRVRMRFSDNITSIEKVAL